MIVLYLLTNNQPTINALIIMNKENITTEEQELRHLKESKVWNIKIAMKIKDKTVYDNYKSSRNSLDDIVKTLKRDLMTYIHYDVKTPIKIYVKTKKKSGLQNG